MDEEFQIASLAALLYQPANPDAPAAIELADHLLELAAEKVKDRKKPIESKFDLTKK